MRHHLAHSLHHRINLHNCINFDFRSTPPHTHTSQTQSPVVSTPRSWRLPPQPLQHLRSKHGGLLRVLSGSTDELWSVSRQLPDDHGVRRAMCALWRRPMDMLPSNADMLPSNVDMLASNADMLPSNVEPQVKAPAPSRKRQQRNPFVAAALSEMARHHRGGRAGRQTVGEEDSYSDLEDFIVCMPGRDYDALLRDNFAYTCAE